MRRKVFTHMVTMIVTYLLCGAWVVFVCDPHNRWPTKFQAEVAATWAWRMYLVSEWHGWRKAPSFGGDA